MALTPKRDALRAKLLDVAEAQIAEGGIVALRARDLATQAGCALGAIYTVYGDLGDLALAVNRRTLTQMTQQMAVSVDGLEKEAPTDILITLSQAYLSYADDQRQRWRTLFSIGISPSDDEPGFFDAVAPLIALYEQPLARLMPANTSRTIARNARTLFAAVHGLVSLGLETRINVVNRGDLERMISRTIATLTDREAHL